MDQVSDLWEISDTCILNEQCWDKLSLTVHVYLGYITIQILQKIYYMCMLIRYKSIYIFAQDIFGNLQDFKAQNEIQFRQIQFQCVIFFVT